MPGGPGVPNRNVHFAAGAHDDPPFDLPAEKAPYYDALEAGEAHKAKMEGMGVAERHEYMRGLRETLNDSVPKPGDFDNPLKKHQPKERTPRRQADPVKAAARASAHYGRLARKAKGRRR